jgi:hypothetical protein
MDNPAADSGGQRTNAYVGVVSSVEHGRLMPALPIVAFCKSYAPDLERCAQLVKSFRRHNRDLNALYLSVPAQERTLFRDRLGSEGIEYLSDEEIVGGTVGQSWESQQLVKLSFGLLDIAENYFWIDSDFVIIRDFDKSEFFAFPGIPFTVAWELRSNLFQRRLLGGIDMEEDTEHVQMIAKVRAAITVIRDTFNRQGPLLCYGAPAIWSAKVVRALAETARGNGVNFERMLGIAPFELTWYGEFLMASRTIPVIPRDNMALHFTRDYEYQNFLKAGWTMADLAEEGFLAVNFASKWMQALEL